MIFPIQTSFHSSQCHHYLTIPNYSEQKSRSHSLSFFPSQLLFIHSQSHQSVFTKDTSNSMTSHTLYSHQGTSISHLDYLLHQPLTGLATSTLLLQFNSSLSFWFHDPFTFLKITDDPIRFYLCGLYLLIFTVLESKTKKHLKDKNTHTFNQLSEQYHHISSRLCKLYCTP